jgi:protoheme IX farnesyltransferase
MNAATDTTASPVTFFGTMAALNELTKPRITASVVASMAVGFLLASGGSVDWAMLAHALFGTWMIAGGTAAHNQFLERDLDKLMVRTAKRPLPSVRLDPASALFFSLVMIYGGVAYFMITVNVIAGMVSLATSFIYLVFYTPLKRVSFANVPVGAVAGALPPVGGWAAVSGDLSHPGMWALFAVIFFWQIPHVLSIAWLLKDDYAKAGFHMLPKHDASGRKTGVWSVINLALLLPTGLAMAVYGLVGTTGFLAITAISLAFLATGIRFLMRPATETAKPMLFASLAYLPLVWIVVVLGMLLG